MFFFCDMLLGREQ